MRTVPFLARQVGTIGIGTARIGSEKNADGTFSADKEHDVGHIWLLQQMFKQGMNHIDMAEIYGAGHTEEIVGRAISSTHLDKIILASKAKRAPNGVEPEKAVVASAKGSTIRLKVADLDMLYLHEPYEPLERYAKGLKRAIHEGYTMSVGFSRFNLEQCKRAWDITGGYAQALQVSFSLAERRYLTPELMAFCADKGMTVVAYRPLLGVLEDVELQSKIAPIAAKYTASIAQIALAWATSFEGVITIVRSSNLSHIGQNARAGDIKLEQSDIDYLTSLR